MPVQSYNRESNSQNVFIGLDVHLNQWNVCIHQGGITRKAFQQPADAMTLLKYLQRNYPSMNYLSAYEAGVCGTSVHYNLMDLGIKNIIINAADVSQTHKEKVRKTDAVDASKIARALANGELRSIHIPPQWRVTDRNLLRLRATQVSDIKRQKIRVRHFLHNNGIAIPEEFRHHRWPKAFLVWLLQTGKDLDNTTGVTLKMMTDSLSRLLEEHRRLNRRLLELMKEERYANDYNLLLSIPGIGRITAISILLECGDLTDFRSAEAFCSYVGLVPDIHRSDTHDGRCGITHRRHKMLRYMLTECAWRAIRKDEHLSRLYVSYTSHMPCAKAIVKIANKLAKIIKFVLKNKTKYVSRP